LYFFHIAKIRFINYGKRLFKSFYQTFAARRFFARLATVAAFRVAQLQTARPKNNIYLVTPEKYGQFSARGAQITEETWTNPRAV
jgi:hypothetical protein